MGYLDGSTITVDAIITKYGRVKLARGSGMGISKFALSDDGINYQLWNIDHPSGSNSYGEAIENLPQLEPVPDENLLMRYKLATLDRGTTRLPVLYFEGGYDYTIDIEGKEGAITIKPKFRNTAAESLEWKIYDVGVATFSPNPTFVGATIEKMIYQQNMPSQGIATGKQLIVTAKPTWERLSTTIEVTGTHSGVKAFITLRIEPNQSEHLRNLKNPLLS